MASSTTSLALNHTGLEDVLAHLPISAVTEYLKGQVIYDQDRPSKGIYLVMSGNVEISQITDKGRKLLMEIVRPDELFGESAFLAVPSRSENATAFEKTSLMTWPISDVEDLVMKRPRLAVALMQILAQRNVEFTRRIESYSTENIDQRLARTLIRFCERLGTIQADGTLRMMPVTHELLSRYVGTSREIVTHHMNRFRKQGYVSYSRRGLVLYRDAMKASIS
jgi:CRP/FNR family cyclic AMP-dependent transcriptional regulator